MQEYKILFTGAVGAGKTTAINAISEVKTVSTDVQNTDESIAKLRTTVGLDFGMITLENGDRLRLFGTPGQERFDFLWKSLVENALGIIILIDNSAANPKQDLETYLNAFSEAILTTPCVIGVTRYNVSGTPNIDSYSDFLALRNQTIPTLEIDPRIPSDVHLLIDVLLTQIQTQVTEDDDE